MPEAPSREVLHEEAMLSAGADRYVKKITKAKVKGREHETDYGQHLMRLLIDPLSEAVVRFIEDSKKKPGRKALAAVVLQKVKPEVLAFITARACLAHLTKPSPVQAVAIDIGKAVEEELRFRQFQEEKPEDFKGTKRYLKEGGHGWDRDKRRKVLAHACKVHEIAWRPWSSVDQAHVGMALIDLLLSSAGDMFVLDQAPRRGRGGNTYHLVATTELLEWVLKAQEQSALLRPLYLPMVEPPAPWFTLKGGGYHLPRLKKRIIRGRLDPTFARELGAADMQPVYQAVNSIQATQWTVDPFILETALEAARRGIAVEGLPTKVDLDAILPPRPRGYNAAAPRGKAWDGVDPEEKKTWKRTARRLYHVRARATSRSFAAVQLIAAAKAMMAERVIYFPYTLDFRGRMYPMPAGLNPQGSDLAKALLRFAESKPLGERGVWWLAVHVANNFGIDKVDLEQRVAWTRENSKRLAAMAADPLSDLWWTEADKPWLFLQAAMEWKGYVDEGPSFESSLPITIDGSCNGIQHLAAMSLDEEAGRSVNLVPAPQPADIYKRVADTLLGLLKREAAGEVILPNAPLVGPLDWPNTKWAACFRHFGIDRKMTKRPTMVQPYGGTMSSCAEYIEVRLKELQEAGTQGPWGDRTAKAAKWLAPRLWLAMTQVITGPRVVMDWLQSVAKEAAKHGKPTTWVLPTGFICQQLYRDTDRCRIETKVGDTLLRLIIASSSEVGLNKRRQRSAIAPNFIHSYDAAALMLTINRMAGAGVTCLTANHDCYGTLAADMDLLADITRQEFVALYKGTDVLGRLREQVLRQLPPEAELPLPPPAGTLDVALVQDSPFFFA